MSKFSSRILILHHQKQTTLKGVKLFKSNKISNMASQFLNKEACHLDSQANKLDVAAPSPRRTGVGMATGTKYLRTRRYQTRRARIRVWVCVRGYGRGYNSKPNGYLQTGLKNWYPNPQTRKPANNDSCDVLCMRLVHLFAKIYLFPQINGVDVLIIRL